MMERIRLGVNIDHVATLRNARGGAHPCPIRAALAAEGAGADGITVHLREDRRHIREADVLAIKERCALPVNLEMAATREMAEFAMRVHPHAVCVVPEKRAELTTEGGLSVVGREDELIALLRPLQEAGMRLSLFLDPDREQLRAAKRIGTDIVELHTGAYANATTDAMCAEERRKLRDAAELLAELDVECHAGHGLTDKNVGPICRLKDVRELNVGHFLIGEALFVGLEGAISSMRRAMDVF
ncbi:MAG: pyridoxine 5'-phosphate synthase [Rickettsiales bacterium]